MKLSKKFVFTVFGASGSLAKLKIFPAIYKIIKQTGFAGEYLIIGYARTAKTNEEFRQEFFESIKAALPKNQFDKELLKQVLAKVNYCSGQYDNPDDFKCLKHKIDHFEQSLKLQTPIVRCFYLAIPPTIFATVGANINQAGLKQTAGGKNAPVRLIIEKPFGNNLKTARQLDCEISAHFTADEIYRIDHYLGKETVQNLLIFRFANSIIEPLFNSRYISNIQITSAESLGIGGRAGYFDSSGIMRDMIQPHVLQILSLIAMARPATFAAKDVKDEKVKLLRSVRPVALHSKDTNIIRGQYTAGKIQGEPVAGYLEEKGVKPNSQRESFTAMKLFIDNQQWFGVPFFLRAGKRMLEKSTEINIEFKNLPALRFDDKCTIVPSNILTIKLQPEEAIFIKILSKVKGQTFDITPSQFTFFHSCEECLGAYSRLILDALQGDQNLFIRPDEIEAAWEIVDPVIESFEKENYPPLEKYAAGTDGPDSVQRMVREEGYGWV